MRFGPAAPLVRSVIEDRSGQDDPPRNGRRRVVLVHSDDMPLGCPLACAPTTSPPAATRPAAATATLPSVTIPDPPRSCVDRSELRGYTIREVPHQRRWPRRSAGRSHPLAAVLAAELDGAHVARVVPGDDATPPPTRPGSELNDTIALLPCTRSIGVPGEACDQVLTWSSRSAKRARRAEAAADVDRPHGAASSSATVWTGISAPSTPV